MSNTPRVDAVTLHCDVYRRNGNEAATAWDFARTLERELATEKINLEAVVTDFRKVKEERDNLRAECEGLANLLWEHPSAPCDQDSAFEAMKRVKELRAEVERLREQAGRLTDEDEI